MIFLINVGFSRLYFRSYRYRIQNSGQYKNVTHPENTGNIKALLSYKYPRLPAAPPPPICFLCFWFLCFCRSDPVPELHFVVLPADDSGKDMILHLLPLSCIMM